MEFNFYLKNYLNVSTADKILESFPGFDLMIHDLASISQAITTSPFSIGSFIKSKVYINAGILMLFDIVFS